MDDRVCSSILAPKSLGLLKEKSLRQKNPFNREFYRQIKKSKLVKIDVTDVPENSRMVLSQLDSIEDLDGVLTIDKKFDLALVFLLMKHPKAEKIKQIRFDSWCTDTIDNFKTKYKENIRLFQSHYKIKPPEDLLHLQCFYEEANIAYGDRLLGETGGYIWLEGFEGVTGIFSGLFENKDYQFSSTEDDRSGHQELSYTPTFWYGSEGVSQGYIFDYQLNQFADIGYNNECYVQCGSLWKIFISKLTSCASEFSSDEFEELLDEQQTPSLKYKDLSKALDDIKRPYVTWFLSLLACGYTSAFEQKECVFSGKNKLRYETDLSNDDLDVLSGNGKYFLTKTYPICLIDKNKIFGKMEPDNPYCVRDLQSFLDKLSLTFEPDYKPRLSLRISNFLTFLLANRNIGFLKDSPVIKSYTFNKDGLVSDRFAETVVESMAIVAEKLASNGIYGFGFILGLLLWNYGDPVTQKYATNILSKLPDEVFQPFLKKLAFESRYNPFT